MQELGLLGIPLPECKSIPELFFFDVVGQTNAIIHLLDKQFSDSLLPLVASTPKHADCLTKKKKELEKLEQKIDAGVDRSLNALVGWVKTILTSEQKKSDFNEGQASISGKVMPNAALPPTTSTAACNRVVKFVNYQVDKIRESLDGKNIEFVLYELGVRLHWVIYQHMQQFTYSSAGVMAVICDVQVISKPSYYSLNVYKLAGWSIYLYRFHFEWANIESRIMTPFSSHFFEFWHARNRFWHQK